MEIRIKKEENKMAKTNIIVIAVIILVVIAGAFYFMNKGGTAVSDQQEQTPAPQEQTQTTQQPESQGQIIKEFTMTAKKFEFEPSTITVNQGDLVKLTIDFLRSTKSLNETYEPSSTSNNSFSAG